MVVYKLTVANTVEERIIDLQEKKRLLAQQAIESGAKKDALKLGLAELVNLFKPGEHFATGGDVNLESVEGERSKTKAPMEFLSRKPNVNKRPESSVYGRRW